MSSPDISGFVKSGRASVIFDGQFGSTGKGVAGAWVGEHNEVNWCTTNASANAGHTTILNGGPVVLFHIPSSFLTARENNPCNIYINAGAIVDLQVLIREIEDLRIRVHEIYVNPNAAVILPSDTADERESGSSATKIASTQKGVGASLARKVLRRGPNLGMHIRDNRLKIPFNLAPVSLNQEMFEGKSVVVEVPQGFSLSLNSSGFYPHTTSRDCTLQQGLADAAVHPRFFYKSMAVVRTFPIRVGNIADEKGRQIGFSGRGYPDQFEKSWEELGQTPERTTVTNRVRRVFSWSEIQYEQMLRQSRPDVVFLNFANYTSRLQLNNILGSMTRTEQKLGLSVIKYLGYGPKTDDISEFVK
jgi:adenylosuccinate synthase